MGANKNASSRTTALHELLGVTPEQVDADLKEQGLDRATEIAALRRMGEVMAAKFAPQVRHEEIKNSPMAKQFPMFEETVAAGSPEWAATAAPHTEASINDIVGLSDPDTNIWVPVSGWSMRDEGINDGDLVLVDTRREAVDGDIVVAFIEGEGQVVKRLRTQTGHPVVLESANPDFPPRVIDETLTLRIHGVVVGRAGRVGRS